MPVVGGVVAAMVAFAAPVRAAGQGTPLIVLPFAYLDTSGEPQDQRAAHANRLSAMADDIGTKLQETGLYRIVPPAATLTGCDRADTACILKGARDAGAAIVLTGAVQKVSTMASDIWIGAFDAANGQRLFYRQLTFRGDTDEAWQHATSFLFHQIEAAAPKVP